MITSTFLIFICTQILRLEPVFQSLFLLFQQECEIVKFERDTFTFLVQLGDFALCFAVLRLPLFHFVHVFNVSSTMGGSEDHELSVEDCLFFLDFVL